MIEEPKHDDESLAMEEQFGIPVIERDFGEEGRLIVPVDTRKVERELKATSARLDALGQRPTRRSR